MNERIICYHGTNKVGYNNILDKGYFQKYTYFATHLEDSIAFGGRYIFEVCFIDDKVPKNWQFKVLKNYSTKNIVRIRLFQKDKILQENKSLGDKIFKSAMIEYKKNNRNL